VGVYDMAAHCEEYRDVAALAEFTAAARAAFSHRHTAVITELRWVTVQLGPRRFPF